MSKEKKNIHLVYVTEEDAKIELQEKIDKLTDEQKSNYQFEGEDFYEIGSGHDFVYGWFTSYVTKSGIKSTKYFGYDNWNIDGNEYEYKDEVFVEIPKQEYKSVDFSDVTFPVIKNIQAKTIGEDLVPVQPKNKEDEQKGDN